MTQEGGISAGTPPSAWRVWVGMPMMGRGEGLCIMEKLRHEEVPSSQIPVNAFPLGSWNLELGTLGQVQRRCLATATAPPVARLRALLDSPDPSASRQAPLAAYRRALPSRPTDRRTQ